MKELYKELHSEALSRKLRKEKLIAVLVTFVSLAVLVLDFLLSDEESGGFFLIANIAITLSSGWFLFTFVFYVMKTTRLDLGFARKIESSEKKEYMGRIAKSDAFSITIGGKTFRSLYVRLEEKKPSERVFYFPGDWEDPASIPGARIKILAAESYVLAYGVENE